MLVSLPELCFSSLKILCYIKDSSLGRDRKATLRKIGDVKIKSINNNFPLKNLMWQGPVENKPQTPQDEGAM